MLGDATGYAEIATGEIDNNDALLASRWVLEARYGDCTVTALSVYLQNAAGNVRIGLYNESAGAPGTLIAATPEAAAVNGHNRIALSEPVGLAPGAYWLCVTVSSAAVGVGTRTGYQVTQSRFVSRAYQALPASWPGGGSAQDLHRCIYAEATSDTLFKPADPAAPSAPAPISGQGYSLVWRDEFMWLDRSKWTNQVWWDGPGRPNTQYVQDGVLHVVAHQSDGWPNVTIDTLGFLDDLQEGYFECRMRDTGSRASYPAFWLFSTDWAKRSDCSLGDRATELDVVETWGSDDPTDWSGTCHRHSAGGAAPCPSNISNSNSYRDETPTVIVGEWHTYGLKWTTTQLAWYLDDTLSHTETIGSGSPYGTVFAEHDMHLIIYQWPDRGNTIDGSPLPTPGVDPSEIHTEVDWVRVWQVV